RDFHVTGVQTCALPIFLGRPVGDFLSVLIAFTLFEAAYYSEIIRAGISSVRRGQLAAALALGMSYGQTMRLIVLPQAFRAMIPIDRKSTRLNSSHVKIS